MFSAFFCVFGLLTICTVVCAHGDHRHEVEKLYYCDAADCKAVARKDGEAIRASLKKGKGLCNCVCDEKGNTLLHLAGPVECVVCADVMIRKPLKCKVDVRDFISNTPLHDAAEVCQSPMTNLYLDKGADPNAENAFGMTPLCLAVSKNEEKCAGVAQDLIRKGAKKCKKCNGRTPFQLAKNKITRDILKQLGADKCR